MNGVKPPLVVGVDGSDSSLAAVDWAAAEAARHGLPLRLVHASLWERYEGATRPGIPGSPDRPADRVLAENVVGTAALRARLHTPDVPVTTAILPEEAPTTLLRESVGSFAVVTGSRGRGEVGGLLLGSVGLTVAARAHCPVIVVRGDKESLAGTHGRILLGVGESDRTSAAVAFAVREAAARRCTLDAVRAWRCPAYENTDRPPSATDPAREQREHESRAAQQLDAALSEAAAAHPEVPVRHVLVEGPARKLLLQRTAAADLVVVGARRRHSHFGLQLGRVGHALLHHAHCPVAIVPERPR